MRDRVDVVGGEHKEAGSQRGPSRLIGQTPDCLLRNPLQGCDALGFRQILRGDMQSIDVSPGSISEPGRGSC